MTLRALVTSSLAGFALWASFESPAWSQANPLDEPPRTGAEAFGREMARFGASWSEYQGLKAERRARLAELERELARCGNCPAAGRLKDEQRSLQNAESTMARVESDTIQSLGLGQYGQSFDELAVAFVKGLSSNHDFGTQHTFERIGDVITTQCMARAKATGAPVTSTAYQRSMVDCAVDLNQHRQLVMYSGALRLCQMQMGDGFVSLCSRRERCDAFEACMSQNSQAVALCRDNVAHGLQPAMGRCFSWMLRPEIFSVGIGSEDRKDERAKQREEAEARKRARDDELRAERCARMARQLEKTRERFAGKINASVLQRSEEQYAKQCGGLH